MRHSAHGTRQSQTIVILSEPSPFVERAVASEGPCVCFLQTLTGRFAHAARRRFSHPNLRTQKTGEPMRSAVPRDSAARAQRLVAEPSKERDRSPGNLERNLRKIRNKKL